ncbi:Zinc finger C2CH-type [Trinorchestia longiramus]|nr:Zinc finger C2CH-type [Trinorchestia longiramus]
MPNMCGVVSCRGNYNKENRRRVFRLPKEQSERQKWLDVIRPCENFVVDPDKFFICEIHWGADPPLIKLHGGSMRPEIPPSIFNVPASCLPSPKSASPPAKVEDQRLRYFLQKDKISGLAVSDKNRDCKATSILCVLMKSLHKGPSLMISDTRPQADSSIPA